MPRGKKTPELKLEVVDAGEMSKEDAEVVLHLLAKMIHRGMEKESMDQTIQTQKSSGAGSQA
jgi:hypothetical protein